MMSSASLKTEFVTLTTSTFHGKIEPGEYWIGDPCYPFSDDKGDKWADLLGSCKTFYYPVGTVNGGKPSRQHVVVAFPTKWGDGEYNDAEGHRYCVDAGLIGIMRADTATAFGQSRKRMATLGRFVKFERRQDLEWDDGKFVFGTIAINTDASLDDDESDD